MYSFSLQQWYICILIISCKRPRHGKCKPIMNRPRTLIYILYNLYTFEFVSEFELLTFYILPNSIITYVDCSKIQTLALVLWWIVIALWIILLIINSMFLFYTLAGFFLVKFSERFSQQSLLVSQVCRALIAVNLIYRDS